VAQFDLDEEHCKRFSGARAGSKQLSLGGADASNVFHFGEHKRTRQGVQRDERQDMLR